MGNATRKTRAAKRAAKRGSVGPAAGGTRMVGGTELVRVMNDILDRSIKPHAEQIIRIWFSGLIPVVVHEPREEWKEGLRVIGHAGEDIFGLPRDHDLFKSFKYPGEKAWLAVQPADGAPSHIFLALHGGSCLLLVKHYGGDWGIAPGTTDAEAYS